MRNRFILRSRSGHVDMDQLTGLVVSYLYEAARHRLLAQIAVVLAILQGTAAALLFKKSKEITQIVKANVKTNSRDILFCVGECDLCQSNAFGVDELAWGLIEVLFPNAVNIGEVFIAQFPECCPAKDDVFGLSHIGA